jgi:PAS domain S-box-containing protein
MTATAVRLASPGLPDLMAQNVVNEWTEPILVLDQSLRIVFANDCFCTWVDSSWSEIEGQPLPNFLGSAEMSTFLRNVQQGSVVDNAQVNCEVLGMGNKALLLKANLLLNSKQQAMLLGISDVTNQRLSNSALSRKIEVAERGRAFQSRQADILRSVLESSGDGIFVSDAAGVCVLWNSACEKILGVTPDRLRQDRWVDEIGIYLPDQVTPFPVGDLPLSRALRGESIDEVELWIRNQVHTGGIWLSVTARPLMGGEEGAVATFRDVTFAKSAKAALAAEVEEVARSNRELEQFAYVAAHDLQEPLRMVSSYVQLLARRYSGKLDAEGDEFIAYASDGARRMSLLISELLNYCRIGQGEAHTQLVNCEEVVRYVMLTLTQKNLTVGAKITYDPLPQIRANEVHLTRLFQNLIDNAIKFRGNEDPRIHIAARMEQGKWMFSVEDNGIGIDPEYKDRVFVIFQRLHSREEYDGTGMGLTVCKKIVEKSGGEIWIKPHNGRGTVVCFTWPLNETVN